jgi:FG-GAP-like repeat
MRFMILTAIFFLGLTISTVLAQSPRFVAQEIDPHVGNVCYAVTVADVSGDGKLDIVAVTEDSVYWYENPTWKRHDIIRGGTEKDNVCIQPQDVDGDGRIDFAIGAGWRPTDTAKASTLQWLGRDPAGTWRIHPIDYREPTLHRLRWGDVKGTGKKQLVVAALQGRGTRPPNWGEGQGVRVLVYEVPDDPAKRPWPVEIADETLHTIHNLQLVDVDGDRRDEIVLACWEGVYLLDRDETGKWSRTKLGSGNQESTPFKGASEVKIGWLESGFRYIATIEPWHGNQVVVYTQDAMSNPGAKLVVERGEAIRRVIAEPLKWGHAVWCANLDTDKDDELIIGQRDPNSPSTPGVRGPGIFVFDPRPGTYPPVFNRITVDDGGMACEDALAADLDGDGRNDILAGGRATHNVKIYWNRPR